MKQCNERRAKYLKPKIVELGFLVTTRLVNRTGITKWDGAIINMFSMMGWYHMVFKNLSMRPFCQYALCWNMNLPDYIRLHVKVKHSCIFKNVHTCHVNRLRDTDTILNQWFSKPLSKIYMWTNCCKLLSQANATRLHGWLLYASLGNKNGLVPLVMTWIEPII